MVGANDIEKSKEFYDKVLGTMGCEPGVLSVNPTGHKRYMYLLDGIMFLISEPIDDQEATIGNGSTIGFSAKNPEEADAWLSFMAPSHSPYASSSISSIVISPHTFDLLSSKR